MIPSLKDWLEATAVFGRMRSKELVAVDKAIEAFQKARTEDSRLKVRDAWNAWKAVHTSATKAFRDNKRNRGSALDQLESEFAAVAATNPAKKGVISRISLQFPGDRPPGDANVSDQFKLDRIDKAFVEAQALLRSAVRRLERGDPDTQALVKTWFGTLPPQELLTSYTKVLDHVDNKLKDTGKPLEVRWSMEAGNSAATGYNQHWMQFGPVFFDDQATAPVSSLGGKPVMPPDFVQNAKTVADEWDKLNTEGPLYRNVVTWCGHPGETLGACAKARWDTGVEKSNYNTLHAMLSSVASLGFTAADPKADAARRAQDAVRRIEQRKEQMFNAVERDTVSIGGAVLHELTHMVLQTKDVNTPLFKAAVACYGPKLCMHLASVAPDKAKNNADNYRLFAEGCQF